MESWTHLEGALLDEHFRLGAFLDAAGNMARFRVQHGDPQQPTMIAKLVDAESAGADEQLARWRLARSLNHPNLEHIYAAGSSEIDARAVIFAVADQTDDNLARALMERPLDANEARELLDALLRALQYLHGLGIAHGQIEPANILAAGNTIKLSADSLAKTGPEAGLASAAFSGDARGLGATLLEALTQRRAGQASAKEISALPAPFSGIVRHTLTDNPGKRWSVSRIARSLDPISTAEPASPPRALRLAWIYILVAVAVVICIFVVTRTSAHAPKSAPAAPPARVSAPPPAVVNSPTAQPPVQAAAANKISNEGRTVWRVVTYTYSRAKDAEHKARRINEKWPEMKAEVFSPNGETSPYLVVLGGRMPREEAMRLRDEAVSRGLPRDTYAQNFSR